MKFILILSIAESGLKDEFYLDNTFHDYLQALKAVRSSVEIYNNKRPHWALNLLTAEQVHASKVA